ncbi:hypothetical protein N182_28805 [Sinorhizobium sp. GL2]|nr:hypothetical protein N182_28805 [Sinorhizobium sp. GL2]
MTGPMPTQLKVRNWERFQHYKDRNPPWIKLHFSLLASEDWVVLDDASKLLAIVCMMIASRNNGMVPNNPAYLKRVAYLEAMPDLRPLISCGFLENPLADDSEPLAPASVPQADARPETETEKKDSSSSRGKRVKVSGSSDDADALIVAEFNERFWPAYPRKVDKKDALTAFQKARKKVGLETIMDALALFAKEVKGKEPRYIRHATKWLNAESWDNEATPAPAAPGNRHRDENGDLTQNFLWGGR